MRSLTANLQCFCVLCSTLYMFRVPLHQSEDDAADSRTCMLSPAEGVRLCVSAFVYVCTLGSQGARHTSHTHTDTHITLCSSSVSSTRDMEGTKLRWITDLGDRRALFTPKLLFSLPHNLSMTPSQLFFSSQYFHAVFVLFLFLLPCFLSERNIVQKHI